MRNFHRSKHVNNNFRETSKTRRASIYDGERTLGVRDPRKAERNTAMRRIYEPERLKCYLQKPVFALQILDHHRIVSLFKEAQNFRGLVLAHL